MFLNFIEKCLTTLDENCSALQYETFNLSTSEGVKSGARTFLAKSTAEVEEIFRLRPYISLITTFEAESVSLARGVKDAVGLSTMVSDMHNNIAILPMCCNTVMLRNCYSALELDSILALEYGGRRVLERRRGPHTVVSVIPEGDPDRAALAAKRVKALQINGALHAPRGEFLGEEGSGHRGGGNEGLHEQEAFGKYLAKLSLLRRKSTTYLH